MTTKTLSHNAKNPLIKEIGSIAAILVGHIKYRVDSAHKAKRNIREGHAWWYGTIEQIAADFDGAYSVYQIRRALKKAVEAGYLIRDRFNKWKSDRTYWYSTPDATITEQKESPEPTGENAHLEDTKMPEPTGENASPLPIDNPIENPKDNIININKFEIELEKFKKRDPGKFLEAKIWLSDQNPCFDAKQLLNTVRKFFKNTYKNRVKPKSIHEISLETELTDTSWAY